MQEETGKLLLFDFDGVIVDSLEVYEGTVTRCLEKIGRPIVKNRDDFLELFEDNFYAALVKKGVELAAFMEAAVDILAQVNYEEIKPYYDLLPVLAKLKELRVMAIISSSDTQDIYSIMSRYRMDGYFRAVLGSDVNFSKQDKINQAMLKFGMGKEGTCYIGDTTGDILEAKTAGIKTIAVTWGWHSRAKLAGVHPDYLIDRPEELLALAGELAL